jgi:uncharacterized membrane protein YhaH (DUF805 family)
VRNVLDGAADRIEDLLMTDVPIPSFETSRSSKGLSDRMKLRSHFSFCGRSARHEYILTYLFIAGASFILTRLVGVPYIGPILFMAFIAGAGWIYLAVTVRRFHDLGVTGWGSFYLLLSISGGGLLTDTRSAVAGLFYAVGISTLLIEFAIALVLLFWPSNRGNNRYGPAPENFDRFIRRLAAGGHQDQLLPDPPLDD